MDALDVGPRSSRTVSRHAFLPAATLRWHPVAWPTVAGRVRGVFVASRPSGWHTLVVQRVLMVADGLARGYVLVSSSMNLTATYLSERDPLLFSSLDETVPATPAITPERGSQRVSPRTIMPLPHVIVHTPGRS
jgi:hypothetical protein